MRYATVMCMAAALLCHATGAVAKPVTAYDGAWSLVFVTQRGACDPSYNFNVNVAGGIITHPNLVRFRGRVTQSGVVHASVTVQDKHADGAGKLSRTAGQGRWNGYSGTARCSGYWTAQRM
jgi:hypothetical protein